MSIRVDKNEYVSIWLSNVYIYGDHIYEPFSDIVKVNA